MSGVDNGGGYACVRAGGKWKISVFFSQFYCKPKIALKNKVFKKYLGSQPCSK